MHTLSSDERRAALHALLKVALPAVEGLPPEQRADAYEGVSVACEDIDPKAADAAAEAASSLREALSAQLVLRNLLP